MLWICAIFWHYATNGTEFRDVAVIRNKPEKNLKTSSIKTMRRHAGG
jgi:hypothetical protein